MKFKGIMTAVAAVMLGAGMGNAQILYKVTKPGESGADYVFGTHHLAPLSVFDDMAEAEEAFGQVSTIVGEIEMGDQMAMAQTMMPYMMAPSDSTLSRVLGAEDYARVDSEFRKWAPMPGMTLQMMDAFRPITVSTLISLGQVKEQFPDFKEGEQLDSYLQQKAGLTGKKVVGLETVAEQAEVLYKSVPITMQAKSLVELVADPAKSSEMAGKLNNLYMEHDIDGLLKLTQSDQAENDPAEAVFMTRLLDQRNEKWLEKLPGLLDGDNVMVVVGALHLPGEHGLIAGLRRLGYTVEAIK